MKRGIRLALIAIIALCSHTKLLAQESMEDKITLSIDRWDGRYDLGETVTIKASVPEEFEAIREIYVNSILESKEKVWVEAGEYDILTRTYNTPTSVMLRFINPDKKQKKDFTDIGYCVGMEHFKPGFQKPADFYEWWQEQVAELRKTPIEATIKPVAVPKKYAEDYVCYDVELSCSEGGAPVRGYMALPRNAEPKQLPICIFTHGAGVKGGSNRSKIDVALRYARQGGGSIAFDINAHGMLNDQPQSYYDELNSGELKNYKERPIHNREDYYFRGMYLRLQRLVDWMCTLSEWDGERILVIGSSQGGAQTAAICGLDNRVTHAVIREPGMMDIGGFIAGRKGGQPWLYNKEGQSEEAFMKWMPYFDTAFFLEHSTAELVYECGWVDMACPPSAIMVGYNLASGNKTIYTYPYRAHGAPKGKYRPEWQEKVMDKINEFIRTALRAK